LVLGCQPDRRRRSPGHPCRRVPGVVGGSRTADEQHAEASRWGETLRAARHWVSRSHVSSPQGTSSALRAWRWGAERGAGRPEVRTDIWEPLRCLGIGVDRLPWGLRHSRFDRARRRSVESSHALVTDLQTDPKPVRGRCEDGRPLLVVTNGSDLISVLFPVPLNEPQKTATPLARDDRHHVAPPDDCSGTRRISLDVGTIGLGGRPSHRLDRRLDPGEGIVQYLFGAVGCFLHIHFLLLPAGSPGAFSYKATPGQYN